MKFKIFTFIARLPFTALYSIGCVILAIILILTAFFWLLITMVMVILTSAFTEVIVIKCNQIMLHYIELLFKDSTYYWDRPYTIDNPPYRKLRRYYTNPINYLFNKYEEEDFRAD